MKKILYFQSILIDCIIFITLSTSNVFANTITTQEEILNYIHEEYNNSPYNMEYILPPLIYRESRFIPTVVSPNGKYKGLTQLNPAYYDIQDPFDYKQNIDCCADYLTEKIAEYGSVELALMCWNAGENKALELYSNEIISDYAKDIVDLANKRRIYYE